MVSRILIICMALLLTGCKSNETEQDDLPEIQFKFEPL